MKFGDITDGISRNGKIIVITSLVMIIVFIVVSTFVFFISLEGAEQVLVPNVVGKDLADALLDLQARELYPRIQLRYSKNPDEKGRILEQDPGAGAVVKGGKRIELVVSQGVAVDVVQNYSGQYIDEVQNSIQALNASGSVGGSPHLKIKLPYLTKYSEKAPGTILEQDPPAGTPITRTMEITFVVSKGKEVETTEVPDMLHANLKKIYELMQHAELTFSFIPSTRAASSAAQDHIEVEAQSLAAQSTVPTGSSVVLTLSIPQAAQGMTFGILNASLTEFPYPLVVSLYAVHADGGKILVTSFKHRGGECSVPYAVAEGSQLVLEVLDRTVYSQAVPAVGTKGE